MALDYLSDNLIELRGPVNVATDAAVSTVATTSTVTAKLYDAALDARVSSIATTIAEDYVPAAVTIEVRNSAFLQTDAIILIERDTGGFHTRTVVSKTMNTVTIDSAFSGGASAGNAVEIHTYSQNAGFVGIDDAKGWENDMIVEFTFTDDTVAELTVGYVDIEDPRGAFIWTNGVIIGTTLRVGALVKRRLGINASDNITMVDFGTFPTSNPVAGDETWGMRGTIPHNHPDLQLGMSVRGEITLVDTGPSPDLNLTRKVVGTLVNK